MYKVKTRDEFVSDLRAISDVLENIRLSEIKIDRNTCVIEYCFICDKTVDTDLQNKILEQAESITPPAFKSVSIHVRKIQCNDQLINNEIYKYLNHNYPSIAIFIKPTDVKSSVVGNLVRYTVRLTKDGANYFKSNGAILKLNAYLSTQFCADFVGQTEIKEASETIDLLQEEVYENELQKIEHRTIKVKDVCVIDDMSIGDTALYIEDATSGEFTICGRITEITEKMTKTGKPMFRICIDDTTGRIGGLYFTRKTTYPKIKLLEVGECIIARGVMGEYNGRPSFTFNKINKCTFPENFVKKDKYKKAVAKEYKLIFPTPANIVKTQSVFNREDALPTELTQKEYVVFDLETTGVDLNNNGITEIGAVKIKDGRIVEQFTTLIKPDYPISEEITRLTGIDEEMVKNAPKIGAVIPDFMKFIDGAIAVAQNASFDVGFIKRFAGAEDYEFRNKVLDTMELGRELLPSLRHHDLHTLAEHFNIVFRHHRALADAYATAEIFIEFMKMKYKA